jgi:predicted metal-dependent phosphoesterase TrpH
MRTRGGYTVLAGDLHIHSFPGDGALPPWVIAHEARRRHLDVIALTNHNSMLSWRFTRALGAFRWASDTDGVLIIPGDEVTGVGHHVAALGLMTPVAWRGSAAEAAVSIHAQGGVAIAAHPGSGRRPAFDLASYKVLDGIEAAHLSRQPPLEPYEDYDREYARALAVHPSIAAIGSSDFHTWAPLGLARTYLFVRAATQYGVLEAIRASRTVGCDAEGVAIGPEPLASLVADDCRADAKAPPAGEVQWISRASAWSTWLGLFALVILGANEPQA